MPESGSRTTSSRSSSGETGAGAIGSLVGVTVFLALLLFAVHLVLNLYGSSVVTAVAFDSARLRAGSEGATASEEDSERHAHELLDGYGPDRVRMTWTYPDTDGDGRPDAVSLRMVAEHPTDLLAGVRLPFQRLDRTVVVRLERLR